MAQAFNGFEIRVPQSSAFDGWGFCFQLASGVSRLLARAGAVIASSCQPGLMIAEVGLELRRIL